MDEIKEKFWEILEFYPKSYAVKVKHTPYEDLDNIIITNPLDYVHHIFLPKKEDLFRFELLAALTVLGEKHHLLSTDYYDTYTRENMYEFLDGFSQLLKPIRFAWAGRIAGENSPDADKLLNETLKRIEIEYLNALYRGNRRAALEVLPYIAFAKGLDPDWDFFNDEKLNSLLKGITKAKIGVSNLLKYAKKLQRYLPCFCSFSVKKDPERGFEVFSLDF
ncbi:MAG TPA: hypothetical protein EYH48_04725 [Aquifex aeolicus]|uniref:Uncharacterized protein n=1 Tax=Aquifex aeolicus TaxID=63363 RepID=A0A9D0YP49_AQUAO|nr:hypothetical protein [Aquificales bacterium]HIP98550.1 hypothetical protein [Aquifex aeolicus]HIQ26613.1 hypothetical protein [Aquifex aeolicus]